MNESRRLEKRKHVYVFLAAGLLVAFGLAGLVSGFASSSPDGLNKVAQDTGFAKTEQPHALAGSPLAGYEIDGKHGRLSTGLAGLAGVSLTFGLGLLVFGGTKALRRRDDPAPDAGPDSPPATP